MRDSIVRGLADKFIDRGLVLDLFRFRCKIEGAGVRKRTCAKDEYDHTRNEIYLEWLNPFVLASKLTCMYPCKMTII